MAANVNPVFPLTPQIVISSPLSAAATAANFYSGTDAIGANNLSTFVAGVNGSRVDFIRVKYASTPSAAPSGTTNATVMHVFINNGGSNTIPSNNVFFTDFLVPSVLMSNTVLNGEITVPLGVSLPAGYRILVNSQAANGATNGAWTITAIGGDY